MMEYSGDEDIYMQGWQLPHSAQALWLVGFYLRVSRARGGLEIYLRVSKAGKRLRISDKSIMK